MLRAAFHLSYEGGDSLTIGVVHLSVFIIQGKCVRGVKDFKKTYKIYEGIL